MRLPLVRSQPQLQHDRQIPAWLNKGDSVVQSATSSGVLKNPRCMDELHGGEFALLFRQADALELKASQLRIALPDGVKAVRVYIRANNSCCDAAVDMVEPVSASDSHDGD